MGRRRTACDTCAAIKTVCSKDAPCARCNRLSLHCSLGSRVLGAQNQHKPSRNGAKSRQQHSKSSRGCTNCRARRKKCDERRPTCGDCVRLGVQCNVCPRPHHSSPERQVRVSDFGTSQSTSEYQLFDWISVIHEEYLTDSARISNLANSSALEVLPDARASDDSPPSDGVSFPSTALANLTGITHRALVRHGLAALSACHLAKVYPDFERNLFLHRSHALEGLKIELKEHQTITYSLAGTLLLCLTEICAGDSRKWLLYLHGGKALLANVGAAEILTPSIEFLIELYNYLCCMTSMTCKNAPQPFCQALELGMSKNRCAIHPIFGIAGQLYGCLARINRIAGAKPTESHQNTWHRQIRPELEAIELELQSWVPPEPKSTSADMGEVRAAAFAIQWAAMLRLRQLMPPSNIDSQDVHFKGPTDHIISALSLIRPGAHTEARLLFPLFIAGTSCTTKASRLTLEYRINMMESTLGFGNVAASHQILDEIWRLQNRGEAINWEDLVALKTPGLVLF